MSRRISCALTVPAVLDRSKTVTRRHVDTWRQLKRGDGLTIVEKAMGLPKGARQVVLAEVVVVSVRVEPIGFVLGDVCGRYDETAREGFPEMSSWEFIRFWLGSHNYRAEARMFDDAKRDSLAIPGRVGNVECRRIEWAYLGGDPL